MAVRSEPGGAMPIVLAALADVFWPEELLRPGVRMQRYTELPSVRACENVSLEMESHSVPCGYEESQ